MLDNCVLELPQIPYDRVALRNYYEETKQSLQETPYEEAWTGTMRRWKVDQSAPVIAEIKSKYAPEITETCKIIMFEQQSGFSFYPHIDYGRTLSLMYPIYPEDGGVATTFYNPDIITEEDWANQRHYLGRRSRMVDVQYIKYEHDDEDVIYEHYYSTEYPTICNIQTAHGVVNNQDMTRTYMQICLYDHTLEQVKQLIQEGNFFA